MGELMDAFAGRRTRRSGLQAGTSSWRRGGCGWLARLIAALALSRRRFLARFADALLHPPRPGGATVPAAWVIGPLLAPGWLRSRGDARALIAVRLLDPRRNGLRRDRRTDEGHAAAVGLTGR